VMQRKRILFANDSHFLHTGYAKYGKELLTRLYNSGKYEIAELGCYCDLDRAKTVNCPWLFYPNSVGSDDPRHAEYKSSQSNEFGQWRFDRVLLDFRPDFVLNINDPWQMAYQQSSPLRDYFNWVIMPTVDSAPQKEEYLDMFGSADAVLTYSQFGYDTLIKEAGNSIKLKGVGSCGVNTDIFYPVKNKVAHKQSMGIPEGINIVGSVMRNQIRKLIPDLIESFKMFIDKCYAEKKVHMAQNTYLYLHTSSPDCGYNIPEILKHSGIANRVMFTYRCEKCKSVSCHLFRGERTICQKCQMPSSLLPNTNHGITDEQLAKIYNMFDVYVQFSLNEGFGVPLVESAMCGVPFMATDYSAMSSLVKSLKGMPIKTDRMMTNVNTGGKQAFPDNKAFSDQLFKFLSKPDTLRRIDGNRTHKLALEQHNWDRITNNWMNVIDQMEPRNKWNNNYNKVNVRDLEECPPNLSSKDFVDWCIVNVINDPSLLNTRFAMSYVNDLTYGGKLVGKDIKPVTRKSIYREFEVLGKNREHAEKCRAGVLHMDQPDYIQFARRRLK
jgi:glycosyltransferase involved in cell wall biosynthesis